MKEVLFSIMAINNEKGILGDLHEHASPDGQPLAFEPELDESHRKRILRKMDMRIIPMVTILYLLSFLDRG